ncbi:MAG: hypothetical protein JOY58_10770, partial [Solirubrobacterales bacterium]|nr:hypothetical protein [Solirubrobacterales bacterium]
AALFASEPGGVTLEELRGKGWAKIDLGQGVAPHAEGRFGTADGRLALRCEKLAERDVDPLPHYAPPAEVADAELSSRFPLALLTPKTHLFLNSTFANQARQASAQPQPYVVVHPDDAAPRGIPDGALVRVFNDRGDCVLPARVSNDARPGVVVAPMGWWGQPGAQATTSQRLTRLAHAPTFNDNRVELARARRYWLRRGFSGWIAPVGTAARRSGRIAGFPRRALWWRTPNDRARTARTHGGGPGPNPAVQSSRRSKLATAAITTIKNQQATHTR